MKESIIIKVFRAILKPYFRVIKPRVVVKDVVAGCVCEEEYFDRLTGISVGYWAYGCHLPNSLYVDTRR